LVTQEDTQEGERNSLWSWGGEGRGESPRKVGGDHTKRDLSWRKTLGGKQRCSPGRQRKKPEFGLKKLPNGAVKGEGSAAGKNDVPASGQNKKKRGKVLWSSRNGDG